MKRPTMFAILFLLQALVVACSKPPQTQQSPAPAAEEPAIRAALEKYLRERGSINLEGMEIVIKRLDIQADHAEAKVEFRARQGGGSMEMAYELEHREGVWAVKKTPGTSGAHGGMTTQPAAPAGQMPPGHPQVASPPPPKKQ